MSCADTRLLLNAYVDGELDAAKSLELERHLQTCAACGAEQKSLHALKDALHRSPLRYSAPQSLRSEVRRMARAPGSESRSRFQPLMFWKSLAFGVTAFAVLAILLRPAGDSRQDQLQDEAVASHVRSLMAQHLTDVASSDQHTVKPWFDGKLDFAPDVKDFASQGFPLVGGRLDYLNDRPVAALVYRRNKHFINVFVWPATSTDSRTPAVTTARGYSVLNREAKGLHYCLVSDLNTKELTELANLVAR